MGIIQSTDTYKNSKLDKYKDRLSTLLERRQYKCDNINALISCPDHPAKPTLLSKLHNERQLTDADIYKLYPKLIKLKMKIQKTNNAEQNARVDKMINIIEKLYEY